MSTRVHSDLDWELIKRRRRDLGLSQNELASALGMYPSALSRLEDGLSSGARAMTVPKLLKLADALSVHPGDLFKIRPTVPAADAAGVDEANARRLGAALITQARALRPLTLATALGLNLDELHRAADHLAAALRPLGMTLARSNLWHLSDDPLALTSRDRAKIRHAERLRYGLLPFEESMLYAIATGERTHEPKDTRARVALASLINQGLVGDLDAHGYAIHPDVAYSLRLEARTLRSTIRTQPPKYRASNDAST